MNIWLALLLQVIVAQVYEDTAGVTDWSYQLVGKVVDAWQMVVYTDKNVIARLQQDGSLAWRHQLIEGELLAGSLYEDRFILITYHSPQVIIRAYQKDNGTLSYESRIEMSKPSASVDREAVWLTKDAEVCRFIGGVEIKCLPVSGSQLKGNLLIGQSQVSVLGGKSFEVSNVLDVLDGVVLAATSDGLSTLNLETGKFFNYPGPKDGKLLVASKESQLVQVGQQVVRLSKGKSFVVLDQPIELISGITKSDGTVHLASVGDKFLSLYTIDPNGSLLKVLHRHRIDEVARVFVVDQPSESPQSMVVHNDGTIKLFCGNDLLWQRDEPLSDIKALEFVQLPEQTLLDVHFVSNKRHSVVTNIINRWQFHVVKFSRKLMGLDTLKSEDKLLVRDIFGFKQVIIAVTRSGKVYAIRSDTGQVLFCKAIQDGVEHAWIVPSTQLVGNEFADIVVRKGESITQMKIGHAGKDIELNHVKKLKGSVVKVFRKDCLVMITNGLEVISSCDVDGTFSWIEREDELVGCIVSGQECRQTWSYQSPKSWTKLTVTQRQQNDVTASLGVVLGNRQVHYKFLNPNAVVVSLVRDGKLMVVLLDVVSGRILHQIVHRNVIGSNFHAVMADHWVVYSYDGLVNGDVLSVVNVLELYEHELPDRRFESQQQSSFETPMPFVKSESFVTEQFIRSLGVTSTLKGISNKDIIIGNVVGQLRSVPRGLISARRPHKTTLTAEEKEELLIPYDPILLDDLKSYLTYSKQIVGVNKIKSQPTTLESTSIVAGYGQLDLFVTRVNPSKTFDILGADFSRSGLILAMSVLVIGIAVAREFANRKQK